MILKESHPERSEVESRDGMLILSALLGISLLELRIKEIKLSEEQEKKLQNALDRRKNGEPLGYILGKQNFYGFDFVVNPSVLIPRMETELLVEQVLEFTKTLKKESIHGLDIGVGSGCIGLTLAKHLPSLQLEGWEKSPEALAVARQNLKQLEISESQIRFAETNALDPQSWEKFRNDNLDFIVSNPPYCNPNEQNLMSHEVYTHEPHLALFAEEDGLVFYRCFAKLAKRVLKKSGKIFLEIGFNQKNAVEQIFRKEGWTETVALKDYQGLDRIIISTK